MQARANSNTAETLLERLTSPSEKKRKQRITITEVCLTNSSILQKVCRCESQSII